MRNPTHEMTVRGPLVRAIHRGCDMRAVESTLPAFEEGTGNVNDRENANTGASSKTMD